MRGNEIVGGFAYVCDNCEEEIPGKSLHWESANFTLCFDCLEKLFSEFVCNELIAYGKVKVRRSAIGEELREKILKKHNYQCVECGSKENLVLDHIVPFSKNGLSVEENLQVLCKKCNLQKGNRQ